MRDTEQILEASRMGEALADARLEFRDLNYEEVSFVQNRGRVSQLRGFYFPAPIVQADLVVSMPKLKTHHWVGVTCSMKNLYGTLPGLKYGWPKNVLHYAGIPQTVVDINASLPRTIAIVDGVTCMEGDGPILGTPKPLGLIAVGVNPMSVDATCARIMGLDPAKVSYMQLGDGRLGTVAQNRILQRGESWQSLASPFQIMEVEHLQALRATGIS